MLSSVIIIRRGLLLPIRNPKGCPSLGHYRENINGVYAIEIEIEFLFRDLSVKMPSMGYAFDLKSCHFLC